MRGIIIPGGGQKDLWQTLSCRGRYAGEIRLEITYYDIRTKNDKIAIKPRLPTITDADPRPMKPKGPVQRRPLPSDPVTGEIPQQPASAPPTLANPLEPPPQHTPPRAYGKQQSQPATIPHQSPLQAVEYNMPSQVAQRHRPSEQYSMSSSPAQNLHYSSEPRQDVRSSQHRSRESYETPVRTLNGAREYIPNTGHPHHNSVDLLPAHQQVQHHNSLPELHDPSSLDDTPRHYSEHDDDRPPPPPVHRSRHGSTSQEIAHRGSFDSHSPIPSSPSMPMRHDVLKSEAHRHSVVAYPGRPEFRPYDSAPAGLNPSGAAPESPVFHPSPPKQYSHEPSYHHHQRSLQPTVEEVPDSPAGYSSPSNRRHRSSNAHHEDDFYTEKAPSPAPLNLTRSAGVSPVYGEPSPTHNRGPSRDDYNGVMSTSPMGYRDDFSRHNPRPETHSHQTSNQLVSRHQTEPHGYHNSSAAPPPMLPASLIPGVDPYLSQEISHRIREDRYQDSGRYNVAPMAASPREHERLENTSFALTSRRHTQDFAPHTSERHEMVPYSNGRNIPSNRQREVSPNPHQVNDRTIRRKSVSPAPPSSENRRASQTPFGPDSYDSFNPSLVSSREVSPGIDPNAKIITHDGREIDPSDHLPMDTWAPEPEPKQGGKQQSPEPRSRPSLGGAQPMPPSGRRPLRVARQSTPMESTPYYHAEEASSSPGPSGAASRLRLQKKSRHSEIPSSALTRPLAPSTADNSQGRYNSYSTGRGDVHSNTWDYSDENRGAQYHDGPPIPAKVPMPVMSGANGGANQALMEEMQRIDIGAGRSRRRGGY